MYVCYSRAIRTSFLFITSISRMGRFCGDTKKENRPCERVKRRLPIFPRGCPLSIIGAEELNFRVRDGNGCTLFAIVTGSPAHTGGSLDRVYNTTIREPCQYLFCGILQIRKIPKICKASGLRQRQHLPASWRSALIRYHRPLRRRRSLAPPS